jgi:hypothetical protein
MCGGVAGFTSGAARTLPATPMTSSASPTSYQYECAGAAVSPNPCGRGTSSCTPR